MGIVRAVTLWVGQKLFRKALFDDSSPPQAYTAPPLWESFSASMSDRGRQGQMWQRGHMLNEPDGLAVLGGTLQVGSIRRHATCICNGRLVVMHHLGHCSRNGHLRADVKRRGRRGQLLIEPDGLAVFGGTL